MSTFYSDGYQDASHGRKYSPPDHPETNVYSLEYSDGFTDGLRIRRPSLRKSRIGTIEGKWSLQLLVAEWNESTSPYTMRTDHEHTRHTQRARAIKNRLRRLGFCEGLNYAYWESGRMRVIG